ncbi:MAG: Ig-like domain-containing protein [Blautia sp.]|nr:Ig-like domain-containing protein [Blautia sp.]
MKSATRRLLAVLLIAVMVLTLSAPSFAATKTTTPKYPSSISLNHSTILIYKGKSATLKATITPDKVKYPKVKWSSSNKKIVSVSSKGVIKGVKYGKATITAKTANGKKAAKCTVYVGSQYATSIKLNETAKTLSVGGNLTLKATTAPAYTKEPKTVTYSTSNPAVATVSETGVVHAEGYGKATITATVNGGKKATCTITVNNYTVDNTNKKVTVTMNGVKRTYKRYAQNSYGGSFWGNYGCVSTATAIVASGFGITYTPKQIHDASATTTWSERYAVKKLGLSTALFDHAAISVLTSAQILRDLGIPAEAHQTFSRNTAIAEITAHVKSGKPVILKAHNRTSNGNKVANGHHAMVLIGIDASGKGIFIDPSTGKMNYAHASHTTFHMTITDFVNRHMDPASGNYQNRPYVTSNAAAGGYILVG